MSTDLNLTIASVSQTFFNGGAKSVIVPGVLDEMQLSANHEAIISNLKKGKIIIEKNNGEKEITEIESGILEHSDNHTTILIESPDPTAKPE